MAVVVLFLAVWLSGMMAALAFGGCTERPINNPRTAAYCTTAIHAGVLLDLVQSERAKRSTLFLAHGLLLAPAGNNPAAENDLCRALRDAARAPRITFPDDLQQPDLARIFATMQRQPAKGATTILWLGVVRDLACPSTAPGAQDLCAGLNGQGLMPLAHRRPWTMAAP